MSHGESKKLVLAVSFDECYNKLTHAISSRGLEINLKSIVSIIKLAMEIVESTQVKGKEQKVLVEKIVRKIVVKSPISDAKEKLLLDMIDEGIVGNVIELVVSASKGEINLNAIKDISEDCCVGCFKSCKKK